MASDGDDIVVVVQLRAVVAEFGPGPLPPSASLMRAEPSSFLLTTIKQPKDDSTRA